MPFMEHSGPIQPQKQACGPDRQAESQLFETGSQRMMDASVGPQLEADTESMDMETHREGREAQSESGAEVDEGKLMTETVKKVMELLCDEAVRKKFTIDFFFYSKRTRISHVMHQNYTKQFGILLFPESYQS